MSEIGKINWRDSGLHPRFGPVDARAAYPMLLTLVHLRVWTLVFSLVIFVIFWVIERQGLRPADALRSIRSFLAGKRRPATAFAINRRLRS